MDSAGNAYLAGWTTSTNFPITAGAYQTTYSATGGTTTTQDSFVAEFVAPAASTTSLVASSAPAAAGQSVTFTATVAANSGTPTGTVTFKDGTTTLATEPLSGGVGYYTTSSLAVGGHSITAVYNGESSFATSTSAVLSNFFVYTLMGDANLDGTVNQADLDIVLSNYNQTVPSGLAGWEMGDFYGTGTVNQGDLNVILSNYNQGSGVSAANVTSPTVTVTPTVAPPPVQVAACP